jgi:hypothetical protein
MTQKHDVFRHTSLGSTKGCIRLLEILPQVNSAGLIQCRIWHSTTNATYKCLSYVWGPEGGEETIMLNGKKFCCRKNLYNFIKAAFSEHSMISEAFWIDAICIDQKNDLERNQQVAHMGDIYSKAVGVIAWLGSDEKIASFFRFVTRLAKETHSKTAAMEVWKREQVQVQANWTAFWLNAYWTRAWITQELFLANSIQILAQDVRIGRREFKSILPLFPWISKTIAASPESSSDTIRILSTYLRVMAGEHYESHSNRPRIALKRRLIDLLHFLPFRESQIPRDQIYSLRAIAEDGYLMPVNYESSDNQFAEDFCRVLNKSRSMCLCSLACIARVLPCDAIQRFPLVKFTVSVYSARRKYGHNVRSGDNETGTICSGCSSLVCVDVDQGHLVCLQQECSLFPGMHLSLLGGGHSRGCRTVLNVITATADGFSTEVEDIHIDRVGAEAGKKFELDVSSGKNDTRLGAAQISIYVRLHPLIRFTSHLEKSNGEICQKALDRSAKFELLEGLSRGR